MIEFCFEIFCHLSQGFRIKCQYFGKCAGEKHVTNIKLNVIQKKPEETEPAGPPLAARGRGEGLSSRPLGAMSLLTEIFDVVHNARSKVLVAVT